MKISSNVELSSNKCYDYCKLPKYLSVFSDKESRYSYETINFKSLFLIHDRI